MPRMRRNGGDDFEVWGFKTQIRSIRSTSVLVDQPTENIPKQCQSRLGA
jgi:hypothetical protein